METAERLVHEYVAKPAAAVLWADCDGENLGRVGDDAHQNKSGEAMAAAGADGKDGALGQQRGEFLAAPGVAKGGGMELGQILGVAARDGDKMGMHAPAPDDHWRAIRPPVCGLASGGLK